MTTFHVLLGLTFAAGLAGAAAQWYIAAFLLTTESIDSPKITTRWLYRCLVFSFWYLASFLITPALVAPLLKLPSISAIAYRNIPLFFGMLAPLAVLLYFADRWLKIRFDPAKVRARNELITKLHNGR